MHGVVYQQLIMFIRENHGQQILEEICTNAGLDYRTYNATKSYPDQDIEKIVKEICVKLNIDRDAALEAFGEYIGPALLRMYRMSIKADWGALDLLENIESTIHRTVRLNNPEASPPALKVQRTNVNEVIINYSSMRHMIHLGIGIVKVIGKHYNTQLNIEKKREADQHILIISAN